MTELQDVAVEARPQAGLHDVLGFVRVGARRADLAGSPHPGCGRRLMDRAAGGRTVAVVNTRPAVREEPAMLSTVSVTESRTLDTEVREIMRAGDVSVPASASLRRVARALREHGLRAVLVVGPEGRPLGWVTVHGLMHNHAHDWELADGGSAITEQAVCVGPSATVREALSAMLARDASHVLVIREGDVVPEGVISETDLVSLVAR
jgi:signal-transduction protein with cAMP-binding, CBS, and nucleotidyltransferase domain